MSSTMKRREVGDSGRENLSLPDAAVPQPVSGKVLLREMPHRSTFATAQLSGAARVSGSISRLRPPRIWPAKYWLVASTPIVMAWQSLHRYWNLERGACGKLVVESADDALRSISQTRIAMKYLLRLRRGLIVVATALVVAVPSTIAAQTVEAPGMAGQIDLGHLRQLRDGLYVIEDSDYRPVVPNIGIVTGNDAVLVIDTGINAANGEKVMALAKKIARGRHMYVTSTHFHPEHGFGAAVFEGQATLLYNEEQREEFLEKRSAYLKLFSDLGMATLVAHTRFVLPQITYADELTLDLGGRTVKLYSGHAGHTRGDQIIWIPDLKTIFMGDLLETKSFPIMPWYPQIGDIDVSPKQWLATLRWAEAFDPQIVVPGHGVIGEKSDLQALAGYITMARDDVQEHCASATSVADLQAALVPDWSAAHPQWHMTEWIRPSLDAFAKDYCPRLLH